MNSGIASASADASRRAAYVRSIGFGMAIGALLGVGAGIAFGLLQGYPGGIPIYAVLYACLGIAAAALIAGVAALVLAIARPPSPRGRIVTVTAVLGVGVGVLVALALGFVPRASLAAAIPIALGAAAIGLGLSAAAERRAVRHPVPVPAPDTVQRRTLAAIAVLLGGALALTLGPGLITLLRERLHYLCSGGAPGTEAAGWTCADGISYLGAGFPSLGMGALVVIAGLLVIRVARDPRSARAILATLATVAVGVGLTGTWLAVTSGPAEVPPGVVRTDFWVEAVLPAAVVAVLSLVIALAGLATRGRIAVVLTSVAAVGILIATVLQPGLALSTLPALGLLAAAALSTPLRTSPVPAVP